MAGQDNKAAIVGVGWTTLSRRAESSILELALQAVIAAAADAGVEPAHIDGLLSYHLNDSVPVTSVARVLGLPGLRWHNDIAGGGSQCASILWDAACAINAGLADYVVVYRALKARSGKRMGQIALGATDDIEAQFMTPLGFRGPVNIFAMAARRWLHERGLRADELAAVVLNQRDYAARNERAVYRESLSRDDYLRSPHIATPLRRLDCCAETDGACALLITSAERARSLRRPPVYIHSAVRGGGPGGVYWDKADKLDRLFSHFIAGDLYRHSGLRPADIDIACLYDAYSFLVPAQLEDFGFCAHGEGIDFIARGDAAAAGRLPVNSHGGLLSEGYVHGLNSVAELVLQLRGDQGARQLPRARTGLCTGFGGRYGSAAILTRDLQ